MTGVKGRSGGARAGTGRTQRRLRLSLDHAEKLAVIVGHKRGLAPTITPEGVVEQWIDNAWTELDAQYQADAEIAHE